MEATAESKPGCAPPASKSPVHALRVTGAKEMTHDQLPMASASWSARPQGNSAFDRQEARMRKILIAGPDVYVRAHALVALPLAATGAVVACTLFLVGAANVCQLLPVLS